MYICPTCNCSLNYVKGNPGVFWRCPSCDGRSATISLLRKNIPRSIVNSLWQSARTQHFPRKRICPSCNNRMAEVPADTGQENQHLDVCTVCQLVWFDYGILRAAVPACPTRFHDAPVCCIPLGESASLCHVYTLDPYATLWRLGTTVRLQQRIGSRSPRRSCHRPRLLARSPIFPFNRKITSALNNLTFICIHHGT